MAEDQDLDKAHVQYFKLLNIEPELKKNVINIINDDKEGKNNFNIFFIFLPKIRIFFT